MLPRFVTLYNVEKHANCRVVREVISELDLVVERVVPCGRGSRVWDELVDGGGAGDGTTLPRLVVQEEGEEKRVLRGMEDIVTYLEKTFTAFSPNDDDDDATPPQTTTIALWRSCVGSTLRSGRGEQVSSAARPSLPSSYQPLVLYSYEGNQFFRLVREVLTELDLPYKLGSAGKGSPRRTAELAVLTGGSTQCPYLVDPNTGRQTNESRDIVAYLYRTYACWTPPDRLLEYALRVVLSRLRPVLAFLARYQAGRAGDVDGSYHRATVTERIQQQTATGVVVYTYNLFTLLYVRPRPIC